MAAADSTMNECDGGAFASGEYPDLSITAWESLAEAIVANGGYAVVPLDPARQQVFARGFECGRRAFDAIAKTNNNNTIDPSSTTQQMMMVQCIGPNDDSAHATGYHPAASSNSMSRYNAHREGFVFSDGNLFSMIHNRKEENNDGNDHHDDDFRSSMEAMQQCLHSIANQAMQGMEQYLGLSDHWFQEHFRHEESHSQWHLKRYVVGDAHPDFNNNNDNRKSNNNNNNNNNGETSRDHRLSLSSSINDTAPIVNSTSTKEEQNLLLPSHTDPSLLSVVVLDQPGIQPGAMGLEVFAWDAAASVGCDKKRVWRELPCHGHGVAIVFVGSVFGAISGGQLIPAAKHRVVVQNDMHTKIYDSMDNNSMEKAVVEEEEEEEEDTSSPQKQERMAATFFLRPKGSAFLQVPPSPLLEGVSLKKNKQVSFDTWNSRVSRNYMKQTKKGAATKKQ